MSYIAIRDAIQGYIQDLAAFDVRDVVIGDLRIFGSGRDPFVIMFNGPFTRTEFHTAGRKNTWRLYLELYVRNRGDGSESEALVTHRQSIIDELDLRYSLGGGHEGLVSSVLVEGDEPLLIEDEERGLPPSLYQRLTVEVIEMITITGGDYPN